MGVFGLVEKINSTRPVQQFKPKTSQPMPVASE
jgi:hypothetical protein